MSETSEIGICTFYAKEVDTERPVVNDHGINAITGILDALLLYSACASVWCYKTNRN